MFKFKRTNNWYIVTYKDENYYFARHESAWAFIFGIRKGLEK